MRRKNIFKTLFFVTVPVILVGATILVLIISQGASVTEGGIVSSLGVIRVNTEPENIDFKLIVDGTPIPTLNNRGTNLEEGSHLIRIEAADMTPWEKKVIITRGVVNEVFAKLFPTKLQLSQVTNTNVDQIFFNSNGDYCYYVVTDSEFPTEKGIWKLQVAPNNIFFINNSYTPQKISDLDSVLSAIFAGPNYVLEPSPDNNRLLISDPDNKKTFVLSNQILNQRPILLDLTKILGFNPTKTDWFNNSNSLILQDDHIAYEYNLTNNATTLITYDPVNNVIVGSNPAQALFWDYASKELHLYQNQSNTKLPLKELVIPETIEKIHVAQRNNRYITIETIDAYYFLDLEKPLIKPIISKEYTLKDYSPDGLNMVFRKSDGVLQAFNVTENIGLNLLETKFSALEITLAENDKLQFTPLSSHLLYFDSTEKRIYTYDRDGNNKLLLLENADLKPFFGFDGNATNLLVLIQDETANTNAAAQNPRVNLYRLSLVKTNP